MPDHSAIIQVKSTSLLEFLQANCTQSQAVSIAFRSRRCAEAGRGHVIGCGIVETGRRAGWFYFAEQRHTQGRFSRPLSWRTLGTLDTFAISWLLTGRVEIAGSIAGLEIVTKIAWYYLHERIWAAIHWGRRHH